jgi:ferredoxin
MNNINPMYKELASRLNCGKSKYIPQIIAKLIIPEQARILLELPVSSKEELADKLNIDKVTLDDLMRDLYEKGCLYYRRKSGVIDFCQNVVELRDAVTSNPKFDEELGEEFFDLWDKWTNEEVPELVAAQIPPNSVKVPPSRVIAHWKSIKGLPSIQWFDDVRQVLIKNADTLTVNPCCCQRINRKPMDEMPMEICLVIRKTADYSVDRGSGRRIKVIEALDILKSLERFALVHITNNAKNARRLISNSDERCLFFRFGLDDLQQLLAPSRFQPTIEANTCLGCKRCLDICLFGASQIKYYPEYKGERAYLDSQKCMGCGNCVLHCPIGCRTMVVVHPQEFVPEETPEV